MGLLDGTTQQQYYQGNDYGNYQFVSLEDIINQFMVAYVGEGKTISKVKRVDVAFHAYRALQELSFDTFRSVRSMEIEIPPSLVMALPHDYVGYTKVTWKDDSGIEHTLFPAIVTSNPTAYNQDSDYFLQFDSSSQATHPDNSDTWTDYHSNTPNSSSTGGSTTDDTDIFDFNGGAIFGAEPKHMNQNGSFYIDYFRGRIHFSSNCTGKTVTLKYISDGVAYLQSGVGTDTEHAKWSEEMNVEQDFIVHKFAQEALIKNVLYACVQSKTPIDHNLVALLKKERFAETRKAKIRLSSIKLEEITQILRGKSKWIKH